MDIRLFVAVMSRFKKIAITGLVAAIALSGLAYMRAGGTPSWEAQAEVLITQPSDPYGAPTAAAVQASSYLGGLSSVYAALANGDAVQAMVRRAAGVPRGAVDAAEVVDQQTGYLQPLITLTSSAPTAADAVKLAEKMPTVLQKYISNQQASADVPSSQRVLLEPVKSGLLPELSSSTSLTVPLLVFMGVMAAVITLIFQLENLKPETAEKLGRVNRPTNGPGQVGELAAVLAALVQNQHSVTGSAPAHSGAPNGHGGGSHAPLPSIYPPTGSQATGGETGFGGSQGLDAIAPTGDPQPRTLRIYEESISAASGGGFPRQHAASADASGQLIKRLLRRPE